MCINRYNNHRSKRKLKAQAKIEAGLMLAPVPIKQDSSDYFLQLEREAANCDSERVESVRFKIEKPLKQGPTAGGKEQLTRTSKSPV